MSKFFKTHEIPRDPAKVRDNPKENVPIFSLMYKQGLHDCSEQLISKCHYEINEILAAYIMVIEADIDNTQNYKDAIESVYSEYSTICGDMKIKEGQSVVKTYKHYFDLTSEDEFNKLFGKANFDATSDSSDSDSDTDTDGSDQLFNPSIFDKCHIG